MAKFKDVADKIARDLRNATSVDASADAAQIREAIVDAIEHFKTRRFWFNDISSTISTSAAQLDYPIPANVLEMDDITCTVTQNEYPLLVRTYHWYRQILRSPINTNGIPSDYAVFENKVFVYPPPNAAYPLIFYGLHELTNSATSTDSLSNAWTNEAQALIRFRAMWSLDTSRFMNLERATVWGGPVVSGRLHGEGGRVGAELRELMRKTGRKKSTGHFRPVQW